jgi:hypothetical protein
VLAGSAREQFEDELHAQSCATNAWLSTENRGVTDYLRSRRGFHGGMLAQFADPGCTAIVGLAVACDFASIPCGNKGEAWKAVTAGHAPAPAAERAREDFRAQDFEFTGQSAARESPVRNEPSPVATRKPTFYAPAGQTNRPYPSLNFQLPSV